MPYNTLGNTFDKTGQEYAWTTARKDINQAKQPQPTKTEHLGAKKPKDTPKDQPSDMEQQGNPKSNPPADEVADMAAHWVHPEGQQGSAMRKDKRQAGRKGGRAHRHTKQICQKEANCFCTKQKVWARFK